MKKENIKKVVLDMDPSGQAAVPMLVGEIPGATVLHHMLPEGAAVQFAPGVHFARILFLCSGQVSFQLGGEVWNYEEKAVFAVRPDQTVDVRATALAELVEIQWELTENDLEELKQSAAQYPFTGKYADATQYRDPFKSEKTISRAIIPQRVVPRFAMGSVETYGDDLIGQHEHPLLDQFFFSFAENNMDLLLDDIVYPMGGNTLLHIPLGCNHGVSVKGSQCAHYIWIDFLFDEKGAKYLDEVHKATGTKREF